MSNKYSRSAEVIKDFEKQKKHFEKTFCENTLNEIKKIYMKNNKQNTIIIDINGALAILKNRGIKESKLGICRNHNLTYPTLLNYQKKAPDIIKFIFNLCRETGLTFEELVKEI